MAYALSQSVSASLSPTTKIKPPILQKHHERGCPFNHTGFAKSKPHVCLQYEKARKLKTCGLLKNWLREKDLNLRPLGYEPNELPDCSIARQIFDYSTEMLCPAITLCQILVRVQRDPPAQSEPSVHCHRHGNPFSECAYSHLGGLQNEDPDQKRAWSRCRGCANG